MDFWLAIYKNNLQQIQHIQMSYGIAMCAYIHILHMGMQVYIQYVPAYLWMMR